MTLSVVIAGGGGEFDSITRTVCRSEEHFHVEHSLPAIRKSLNVVRRKRPQLLLLGLSVPDDKVFDIIQRVSRELPTRVVVMCDRNYAGSAVEALEAGASGYVLTDTADEDVVRLIKAAAS